MLGTNVTGEMFPNPTRKNHTRAYLYITEQLWQMHRQGTTSPRLSIVDYFFAIFFDKIQELLSSKSLDHSSLFFLLSFHSSYCVTELSATQSFSQWIYHKFWFFFLKNIFFLEVFILKNHMKFDMVYIISQWPREEIPTWAISQRSLELPF